MQQYNKKINSPNDALVQIITKLKRKCIVEMSDLDEVDLPPTQTYLPVLLANLKRVCGLWFLTEHSVKDTRADDFTATSSFENIASATVDILRHGLRLLLRSKLNRFSYVTSAEGSRNQQLNAREVTLKKLRDDFEWVLRIAQTRGIRESGSSRDLCKSQNFSPTAETINLSIEGFLHSWVLHNLKANRLCSCLQVLVEEKDLLHIYYERYAFLCNETYSTALFICLTSVELNQYSLLSQIKTELYSPLSLVATKHRRTNSHPVFSISPPKYSKDYCEAPIANTLKETENASTSSARPFIPTFRRTKSLPAIRASFPTLNVSERTRCRTMFSNVKNYSGVTEKSSRYTSTRSPFKNVQHCAEPSREILCDERNSPKYQEDKSVTMLGNKSDLFQQLSSTPSTSSSSCSSHTVPGFQIDLINCDNIKIWTDQAYESKQEEPESRGTEPFDIPQQTQTYRQKPKSVSPIGSFLCNIFSTPPTYTNWSIVSQIDSTSTDTSNIRDTSCNADVPNHSNTIGVFDSFLPVCGKKLSSRNSQNFFEDGISSLDYSAAVHYPTTTTTENLSQIANKKATLPKTQQTLTDYLQNSQMSQNNTELEKENAHFRISEAIISAIEHMKWSTESENWRRRRETAEDIPTVTATDWLAKDDHSKQTLALATESSPNEHSNEHVSYDLLSAEVVGLSLISKFNEKHLPKVSEIKWLVSEEDTPQQLLPLPNSSTSMNPDENLAQPMTRGTRYWAPPRQQIIFTDHPSPNRKLLIKKQNNRCAGCGMRVSPQHIHSFRYCTYLGKYHCTGCHRNQISPIPSKILQNWDFRCYPVSVFAYRLLEQMYTFPLFYVPDLNPALYVNNKPLLIARRKRVHLRFIKDFIRTCRFALREKVYVNSIPNHITSDPDIWSLCDFVDVHDKSMARSIDQLIEKCENHVYNCVLCTARGFHCEYCQKDQVIYPWQPLVFRCDGCGACFHIKCWKLMSELCCRCQRINKRLHNSC